MPASRVCLPPVTSGLVAPGEATYTYDALGRTLLRTQGTDTTTYAYSGEGEELAAETAGGFTTRYANGPEGPLARQVGEGDSEWLLQDLHTDLVGTVSGAGGLEASFTYGAFGEPRHSSGSSTLGFQSDPTDPLTGLVDMGARSYDPSLGRFLTADPLFGDTLSPLTLNRFAYALGDPVTLDDPTGLCPPQYCFDKGYHGVKTKKGGVKRYKSGHSAKSASRLRPPQQRVRTGHDPKQSIRQTKARPKRKPAKQPADPKPRTKKRGEARPRVSSLNSKSGKVASACRQRLNLDPPVAVES